MIDFPDMQSFEEEVEEGNLTRKQLRDHVLYCYNDKCVYDRNWNDVTRRARGVVFNTKGELMARPFPKFFNLYEMPETCPKSLPTEDYVVEEKYDGSLAIAFCTDRGQWIVVTKGSFNSEQARRAQKMVDEISMYMMQGMTYLFEVIYPENRIVVNYGESEELVLLAIVETETGREVTHDDLYEYGEGMGVAVRGEYFYPDIEKLPHLDDGTQSEGYVVRFIPSNYRVKVKNPAYVAIARIMDRISPRRLFKMIESGTLGYIRDQIPEDLAGDFDDISSVLLSEICRVYDEAANLYRLKEHFLLSSRKAFAEAVVGSPVASVVFMHADGKDTFPAVLKIVRRGL